MVGDDEIDAASSGSVRGSKGANAGVNANDEANAIGRGLLDHLVAHAVAFADAVRHVVVDLAATDLQGRLEDYDGGGAVNVVVAINEDGLAALNGGSQTLDGGTQAGHEVGRMQVRERRRKELLCLIGGGDAARC